MNYTKGGEWILSRDNRTVGCYVIEDKRTVYIEIALVYHPRDAGVVRAAPVMYEACRQALIALESPEAQHVCIWQGEREKLKAALAMAEER